MTDEIHGEQYRGGSSAGTGADEPSGSVASEAVDRTQPWVAAMLFFSSIAKMRMLLPDSCFTVMTACREDIPMLDQPPERFAVAAHKSLWSWFSGELRAAVASGKELTISLVVSDGTKVLEAFQMFIREHKSTGKPHTAHDFDVRITQLLRTINIFLNVFDVQQEYASFQVDVSEGYVPIGNKDDDLFHEVSSNVPSIHMSTMVTKELGSVRSAKMAVQCIAYLAK